MPKIAQQNATQKLAQLLKISTGGGSSASTFFHIWSSTSVMNYVHHLQCDMCTMCVFKNSVMDYVPYIQCDMCTMCVVKNSVVYYVHYLQCDMCPMCMVQ